VDVSRYYSKISSRLTTNWRGAEGHPHFAPVLRELKDRSAVVRPRSYSIKEESQQCPLPTHVISDHVPVLEYATF
jgi:hypothetical protein